MEKEQRLFQLLKQNIMDSGAYKQSSASWEVQDQVASRACV